MIIAVDHVGIVVPDLETTLAAYRSALGLVEASRERDDEQGLEEAVLPVGDGCIQLLAPVSSSSTIARFLSRRGPGLHHFALRVGDVERALAEAERRGATVLEPRVRPGSCGTRIGFLAPRGMGGALVEFVERA